jgi:hypothetical protein
LRTNLLRTSGARKPIASTEKDRLPEIAARPIGNEAMARPPIEPATLSAALHGKQLFLTGVRQAAAFGRTEKRKLPLGSGAAFQWALDEVNRDSG